MMTNEEVVGPSNTIATIANVLHLDKEWILDIYHWQYIYYVGKINAPFEKPNPLD